MVQQLEERCPVWDGSGNATSKLIEGKVKIVLHCSLFLQLIPWERMDGECNTFLVTF